MASCTQIDGLLQAYIDGELGASERVILEQHVSECAACAGLLRRQQRSSAALFEAYSAGRLTRDLSSSVLEHLPELESVREDVEDLNWRAKHPGHFKSRLRQIVPVAAAVLLVVLGAVIRDNWPPPIPSTGQFGMVAYSRGEVSRVDAASGKESAAKLESGVYPADRYVSSGDSGLMLSLDGSTHIKMGENSRIRIRDARTITIEKGQVYLDVGKTDRFFRASTPTGDITVFGTRFGVKVLEDSTIIGVEEGEVQIDHKEFDSFATLGPGQIVSCRRGVESLVPWEGNVASLTQWAKSIAPDAAMLALLAERYPRAGLSGMDEAENFFYQEFILTDLNDKRLDSIMLSWEPGSADGEDYCGYSVYVYTAGHRESIFKGTVNGSVFSNPNIARIELINPSLDTKTSSYGWVRLVPELADGLRRIKSMTVSGRTGTNDELN